MADPLNPALRAVSDAVLAVAAQRSVEDVLQQLVDSARELAGARYAALGTPDGEGGFTRFLVAGMSDELIASLGPLPRRHGMLGVVLETTEPYLTEDIHGHPRFRGWWPSKHPGHALVPRRADRRARGRDRRLLPDREDRRRRLRRGRPGGDRAAGGARGDRDHQRRPLRAQPRALDAGRAQPARAGAPRRGLPEAVQPRAHRRGCGRAARARSRGGARVDRAAADGGERGAGGAAHADPRAAPARAGARRAVRRPAQARRDAAAAAPRGDRPRRRRRCRQRRPARRGGLPGRPGGAAERGPPRGAGAARRVARAS